MLCDKCSTIIDDKFNKICYSCGHRYHRTCLLVNKYSLLNPSCDICDDGKIIRNMYIQHEISEDLEDVKGSVVNLEDVKGSVVNLEDVKDSVVNNLVASLEVAKDLVASLEEVKDLEDDLEFGKKDLFHSSKILCIIFCTVYLFNLI